MGLAIITPGVFFISLSFDLLFFNFSAASWLLINEGVPAIIMLYMIYTVFSLYQEMAPKNAEIDAESGGKIDFSALSGVTSMETFHKISLNFS